MGTVFKAAADEKLHIDFSAGGYVSENSGFGDIIVQLIKISRELSGRLAGTNAYLDLENYISAYHQAVSQKPTYISGMYIQALLAEEAYNAIQNDKSGEIYPSMPYDMQSVFQSLLRLNRTALASSELGRQLLDNEVYGRDTNLDNLQLQRQQDELLRGIDELSVLTNSAAEALRYDIKCVTGTDVSKAQSRKTAASLTNLLKSLFQQTAVKLSAAAIATTAAGKAASSWGAATLNQVGDWLTDITPLIISYLEALGYSAIWLVPLMPL